MDLPQQSNTSSLSLSCRFIPHDQWLTTHLDPSWKGKQVKLWILSKCFTAQLPDADAVPLRYRPASPITFAPHPSQRPISPIRFANPPIERSRLSFNAAGADWDTDNEGVVAEEYDDEWDAELDSDYTNSTRWSSRRFRDSQGPNSKPLSSSTSAPLSLQSSTQSLGPSPPDPRLVMHYTLIRFSTGQILEDDFPLSWYALRSYELLELHRAGMVLRLPREVPHEYILPYFEARVKVLVVGGDGHLHPYSGDAEEEWKGLWNQGDEEKKGRDKEKEKDKGKKVKGKEKDIRGDSFVTIERGKIKKRKVEWKERWVVIRSEVLNIFKDENDPTPLQRLPLSALSSLRGPEYLAGTQVLPHIPKKHILCTKFRSPTANKEKAGRGGKGKDPVTRRGPDISINTLARVEEYDMAPPRSAIEVTASTRRRPKSFELEKVTMGQSKLKTDQVVMGASGSPDVKHMHGSLASSTTLREGAGGDGGDGEWVVFNMSDDDAYASILRILHRHFPPPISSSFIPAFSSKSISTPANTPVGSPMSPLSPSPSTLSVQRKGKQRSDGNDEEEEDEQEETWDDGLGEGHPSLSRLALPTTFGALPYPEWRTEVVGRAQRAGVGDVGRALGWVLCGGWDGVNISGDIEEPAVSEPEEVDLGSSEDGTLESTQAGSDTDAAGEYQGDGSRTPIGSVDGAEAVPNGEEEEGEDVLSDEGSEKSEAEWEGWIGDLERQGRENAALQREGQAAQWRTRSAVKGTKDGQLHHGHALAQQLFQQGRRALEPSAIVTPLLNSSTPTTSSVSGSMSSFVLGTLSTTEGPSSSTSTELSAGSNSGNKGGAGKAGFYGASLKSKMPMEEVLRNNSGTAGTPAVDGTNNDCSGGTGPRATASTRSKVNAASSLSRTRSATVTHPKANLNASSGASNGGIGGMFSRKKGREREGEDGDARETTKSRDRPKLSVAVASPGSSPSGPSRDSSFGSKHLQSLSATTGTPTRSRQSILRHVRSGSSLYGGCVGSSSLHVSEDSITSVAVTYGADGNSSGSGTRRAGEMGLVRGVSVRAEKFVKRLDAALDFVDGR